MKKLSVAMLAVFVLAVLTNADSQKEAKIAEEIGSAFGRYAVCQTAMLDAENRIGTVEEIFFEMPFSENLEFGESESPKGIYAIAKESVGECPKGGKWLVTSHEKNGVLKLKCQIDAGCESLTPNLKSVCEYEHDPDAPLVEPLKDPRDGQKYWTVQVDGRVWMADNLNYKTAGSRCLFDKNANCKKYGRLYSLKAAKKACPSGWRLPRQQEWIALLLAAGWNDEMVGPRNELLGVGKKLKSKNGWKQNDNGTDDLGFSVLPGGLFLVQQKKFIEDKTAFWSSDIISYGKNWSFFFDGSDDVAPTAAGDDVFQSIRCVKDE